MNHRAFQTFKVFLLLMGLTIDNSWSIICRFAGTSKTPEEDKNHSLGTTVPCLCMALLMTVFNVLVTDVSFLSRCSTIGGCCCACTLLCIVLSGILFQNLSGKGSEAKKVFPGPWPADLEPLNPQDPHDTRQRIVGLDVGDGLMAVLQATALCFTGELIMQARVKSEMSERQVKIVSLWTVTLAFCLCSISAWITVDVCITR
jgi:hypothetical protein